jgi:hypothetical protein
MSVSPTVSRPRSQEPMSETGDHQPPRAAPRVEDVERALVLAREVAAATSKGGAANLRIDHLRALFSNGNGAASAERMQAALEAAGLRVDPPLEEASGSVSLRIDRGRAALSPDSPPKAPPPGDEPPPRPSGVAAYQAASGAAAAPGPTAPPRRREEGLSLDDAQRMVAAEQAELRTPQSLAALMPALIVPVMAASFLGPLFGVIFAGLALLTSALLSRPGALADGKLGPLRMPASLARSFLLVSSGVAIGALGASIALVAAGASDTKPSDPNAPLEQTQPQRTTPAPATPSTPSTPTTPTAPGGSTGTGKTAAERKAAADRRARAKRRRERAARQRQSQSAPPSGTTSTTPAP